MAGKKIMAKNTGTPTETPTVLTGDTLLSNIEAGVKVINSDLVSVENASNDLSNHTNNIIALIMMIDGSDDAMIGKCHKIVSKVTKKQLVSRLQNLINNVTSVRELNSYLQAHEVKENIMQNQNVFNVVSAIAKVEGSDTLTLENLAERISQKYTQRVESETLKGEKGDTEKAVVTSGDLNKINQDLNEEGKEAVIVTIEDFNSLADKLHRIGEQESDVIEKILGDKTLIKLITDMNNKLKGYKLNGEAEEDAA